MGMHQYIGARYTPRFLGTYDPTQNYENLDVVDNGSGTSYIAKKKVPAGTPLTDTNYWFIYGSASGAILQLQNDVAQLQTDVPAAALEAVTNQNRRYILIADSYAYSTTGGGETFLDLFKNTLGLDAAHYQEVFMGGAAFYHPTPGRNYLGLLQSLSVTDPDTITDIWVIGGSNDANNATLAQEQSEMIAFKTYVDATYPNARIVLAPVGLTFTVQGMNNFENVLAKCWLDWAGWHGFTVIPRAEYILRDTEYLDTDLIHPTADGVYAIANHLIAYALGSAPDVERMMVIDSSDITAVQLTNTSNAFTVDAGHKLIQKRSNGCCQHSNHNANSLGIVIRTGATNFVSNDGIRIRIPRSLDTSMGTNNIYQLARVYDTASPITEIPAYIRPVCMAGGGTPDICYDLVFPIGYSGGNLAIRFAFTTTT